MGYYLTALGKTNTVLDIKLLLTKSLRPFQVNNLLLVNKHPQHKVFIVQRTYRTIITVYDWVG